MCNLDSIAILCEGGLERVGAMGSKELGLLLVQMVYVPPCPSGAFSPGVWGHCHLGFSLSCENLFLVGQGHCRLSRCLVTGVGSWMDRVGPAVHCKSSCPSLSLGNCVTCHMLRCSSRLGGNCGSKLPPWGLSLPIWMAMLAWGLCPPCCFLSCLFPGCLCKRS